MIGAVRTTRVVPRVPEELVVRTRSCSASRLVSSLVPALVGAAWLAAPFELAVAAGKPKPPKKQPGQSAVACDRLPDPRGLARGIERRCRPTGSSAGIARADFNGDGFGDLAVGTPYEDASSSVTDSGAVWVFYGSAAGLAATGVAGVRPAAQLWHQDQADIPGASETGNHFGAALAAGDFDNDGTTDLAIGAPGANRVIIVYGSPDGLSATSPEAPLPTELTGSCIGSPFVGQLCPVDFGAALTWGDFDGDGNNDLAIGAPRAFSSALFPVPGGFLDDAGLVTVVHGARQTPITDAARRGFVQDLVPENGDQFGIALGSGDFDADGRTDLVVGAPYEDVGDAANAGSVHVVLGCQELISTCSRFEVNQDTSGISGVAEAGDAFGWSLAVGDFDGDGRDDLAVGVPYEDSGALVNYGIVQVFPGSASGITSRGAQLWDQTAIFGSQADPLFGSVVESGDLFGYALAAADWNGDGRKDLAIGVPYEDVLTNRTGTLTSVADAGEVDVLYGSGTGLSRTGRAPQSWHQDTINVEDVAETADHFGFTLSAWNFGGPGNLADLAVGVPREDFSQSNCGAVAVLYGSSTANGLSATGDQLWHQGDVDAVPDQCEANDQFGRALY